MNISKIIFGLGIIVSFSSCEKEFIQEEGTDLQFRAGKTDHKVKVCHTNAKMLNIAYQAAFEHLEHGDLLFSCNPSDAVSYQDIIDDLKIKVFEDGGDVNDSKDLGEAFEDWYINDYLTGNWTKDDGNDTGGSGSGGSGSGGIGGGSL